MRMASVPDSKHMLMCIESLGQRRIQDNGFVRKKDLNLKVQVLVDDFWKIQEFIINKNKCVKSCVGFKYNFIQFLKFVYI